MKRIVSSVLAAVMVMSMMVTAWASPCTGDESNMPLWIGMMAVAAILIIVILISMSRKNKKRR